MDLERCVAGIAYLERMFDDLVASRSRRFVQTGSSTVSFGFLSGFSRRLGRQGAGDQERQDGKGRARR